MKKTHVIALLAFTIGLNAQQKSTKQSYSYSLNEAIEYALTHNYNAINAARDIDAAKKKKWETTTIGLPQINAAVGYQNNIELQKSLIPAEFFGGQPGEFAEVAFGTKQNMAATATKFAADGVRMIKVKLGKDPVTDIERIQKIRAAVGPNIILRIDANQGWSYDDAVKALTGLAAFDIQFCEQPMRTFNDHLLPALCKISPIPVMADESVYTHYDAERIIANNACASINIKFAKSGGIKEALAINKVAEAAGIPCMMGGMLESRVALSAKVHVAMSLNNIKFYDLDTCLLGHKIDPVVGGAIYKGMHLELSDAHGIGADVDPAYLQTLEHVII